jgi:hypothetical protein
VGVGLCPWSENSAGLSPVQNKETLLSSGSLPTQTYGATSRLLHALGLKFMVQPETPLAVGPAIGLVVGHWCAQSFLPGTNVFCHSEVRIHLGEIFEC